MIRLKRALTALLLLGLISSLGGNLYFFKYPEQLLRVRTAVKNGIGRSEKEKTLAAQPAFFQFLAEKRFPSDTARIDFLRDWLNAYSTHDETVKNPKALDSEWVLSELCRAWENDGPRPALTCGPRALTLQRILHALDYKSRFVSTYFVTYSPDEIGSHSYLEVLNPTSGRWEICDPDNNVFYVDASGNRLSSLGIARQPAGTVYPANGTEQGYHLLADNYFRLPEAFRLLRFQEVGQDPLILLDRQYFDPDKKIAKDGCTLLESMPGPARVLVY